MGDVPNGHEAGGWIIEWLKYLIGGTWAAVSFALGALAWWINRNNEELKDMIRKVESDSRDADRELLVQIRQVGEAAVSALNVAVERDEDGRRRLHDRITQIGTEGANGRLEDSRTYVTKDDLNHQTQQIMRAIETRGPVRERQ